MSAYYDPYDVAINADPYPTYARLRDEAPLYYNEKYDFWALSRHADVQKALLNWETFSNTHTDILDIMKAGVPVPPGVLLFEDPPLQTVHRTIMSRVFTPRRVAQLEDQIREYCVRCLDPLVGSGGFDAIREYASVVPMKVISALMGIPDEDQVAVRDRTDANLRTEAGKPMEVKAERVANGDHFADYIEWRSHNPSDDIMTQLLNAEFDDGEGGTRRLTRQEVLTYTATIAGAGNETTGRLIGWLTKLLADHPDQRQDLVENPDLIPNAIDETLRFEPTGPHMARWVTREVEYYGQRVPADSAMLLLMGSANRDAERWPDPDVYDVRRTNGPHLTFGQGVHYCLGANLARLEARVALEEFLKRFPKWDLDRSTMKLAPTSTVRGWERLDVTL